MKKTTKAQIASQIAMGQFYGLDTIVMPMYLIATLRVWTPIPISSLILSKPKKNK